MQGVKSTLDLPCRIEKTARTNRVVS